MMTESGSGQKAVRLVIRGYVQGVWYRSWTIENAQKLNLDGWVRNRSDGTVEALVVGQEAEVDELIKRCWQGPKLAKISNIEIYEAMGITPKGFVQKPTVDIEKRKN